MVAFPYPIRLVFCFLFRRWNKFVYVSRVRCNADAVKVRNVYFLRNARHICLEAALNRKG